MMNRIVIGLLCGISPVGLLGLPAPAHAMASGQDTAPSNAQVDTSGESTGPQVSEIVVTAQKRSENIQKVPLAVTAFSSEALQTRAITNVTEIATLTPGLSLNPNAGAILPILRGIGNPSNAVGNESSVAVYVDGVYYSRLPAGFFSLDNIERVEVLKGPQGTLFGRNSSGGVIQLVTSDPSSTTKVKGRIGYGSFNTLQGGLYATTGLAENLSVDVAVSGVKQKDGWGKNLATGKRVGYQDNFTARSKLLWEPSSDTRVLLSAFYAYSLDSQLGNTYPGTIAGYLSPPFDARTNAGFYNTNQDVDSSQKYNGAGGSLRIEQSFGAVRFTSTTGYLNVKEHGIVDLDYGPRPDARADFFGKTEQFTQEFQIGNRDPQPLTWIVGLFYYNTLSSYHPLRFQGPAFIPGDVLGDGTLNAVDYDARQRAKSYAGYAQLTYEVAPGLKVTGGARYSADRMSGSGSGELTLGGGAMVLPIAPLIKDTDKTNKASFKAAVDYEVASDVLLYATFSSGYKSANYNLLPFSPPATKPESIEAYELGFKATLLDRRLRINGAVFQYDVKNPQVQLLVNNAIAFSNAGKARVRGAEIEGELAVIDGLSVNFAASYLDPKYTAYADAPAYTQNAAPPYGALLGTTDASGNRLPQAAKFTSTVGASYKFSSDAGEWVIGADWYHNSGFFWQPDNILSQPAYDRINAQVRFAPSEAFYVTAWVKNLADEKIATFQGSQAGPSGFPYIPAPPRTYGVTLGFGF
jgi:iron complex outermembrane receptor protein